MLEKRGTTTLFSQSYILNHDGTRASVDEEQLQPDDTTITRSTAWTYDALQRLTGEVLTSSVSSEEYSDTFAYDLASNRASKAHVGPGGGASETDIYVYNSRDELTAEGPDTNSDGVPDAATATTYTYDDNGSQTSSTHGGVTTTYTYDVRNKMVGYSGPSGSATYVYDDAGNRVQETTGGATTYYLTDTRNPTGYAQPIEAKPSPTGTPSMTYLIGDRVLGQANGSGVVSYFLVDGHGSTRALADATGAITKTLNYDAFGGALNFTPATAGTVFLFGGDAVYDPVSGTYFHGNGVRQRLGFRFIQMDSYAGKNDDALSLHKYLYVSASPIGRTDPSGRMAMASTGMAVGYGSGMTATSTALALGVKALALELVRKASAIAITQLMLVYGSDIQQGANRLFGWALDQLQSLADKTLDLFTSEDAADGEEEDEEEGEIKILEDDELPHCDDRGRLEGDIPNAGQLTDTQAEEQLEEVETSIPIREHNDGKPINRGHQERIDRERRYRDELRKRLGLDD